MFGIKDSFLYSLSRTIPDEMKSEFNLDVGCKARLVDYKFPHLCPLFSHNCLSEQKKVFQKLFRELQPSSALAKFSLIDIQKQTFYHLTLEGAVFQLIAEGIIFN